MPVYSVLMPVNRYLLVMTACIDPSSGPYQLQRADPQLRLEDYQAALRFWLQYADRRIDKILFLENSGYSLDSLRQIVKDENPLQKEVEFVALDCNWYPPTSHYGYAELRMLDLGLQASRLRETTTHMIKVTGRLTFPGLSRLLDRIGTDFDVWADARTWRTPFRKHTVPFVTTQVILFSHRFYQVHMQGAYQELGQRSDWMESLFYRKLFPLSCGNRERVHLRFPCNVDPKGQPAHRSLSYTHPKQVAVNAVRGVLRRVAPHWWL